MTTAGKLVVTTPSEREIAMTRSFDAPRHLVFEALTTPELLKQWLVGPPGWSMVRCEFDPRPGVAYRYEWRHVDGQAMGVGGVIREVSPPARLVATERFDRAWYPGEAIITYRLVEEGDTTTITLTIRYESEAARDTALKTPMAQGVAANYDRLETILADSPVSELRSRSVR